MGETQSICSLVYKNFKLKKEEERCRSKDCFKPASHVRGAIVFPWPGREVRTGIGGAMIRN